MAYFYPVQSQKTYTVTEATRALERYCAYQERCHYDVEKKLIEMQMIPDARNQIILHLLEHNFLNETRFAQAFARGKFRHKKWGKIRITSELKQRKISSINIRIALKEINETDYQQTFYTLVDKRIKQLKKEESIQKKRKKLMSYLQYRGWEATLIYDAITLIS